MSTGPLDRYFAVMAANGRNPGNLRFELATTFDGIAFENRSVLDIGAGIGVTSLFAASAGATRVVSLEPEGDGSEIGNRDTFEAARARLELEQVILRPETIQEFEPAREQFDVLISRASINHMDETACVRLRDDADARKLYLEIFTKLAAFCAPGADLVVKDAMPHNLFGRLGLKNPLMPTLEWEKHQTPELWIDLLAQVGFREPRVRWTTLNTLRGPGQKLFGNRFFSYLTLSTFVLTMRHP
jgi:SAM-dependent methyltransferase